MRLFRKRIKAEVGHIERPVVVDDTGLVVAEDAVCVLCGHTEFHTEGVGKGRCTECGFPRNPVLIKVRVKERVGNKVVVNPKTRLVSEDALPELRRMAR